MALRIDVITLFPEMFVGPFDASILRRARDAGLLDLRLHQLRDYASGRHATVDDYPYGGGPGMLLKPEPMYRAVEAVREPILEACSTIQEMKDEIRLTVIHELGHYFGLSDADLP